MQFEIMETATKTVREITETATVIIGATVSWVFGWVPEGQVLGTWDKAISIVAGIVAIVVGVHAIINYWRKWDNSNG